VLRHSRFLLPSILICATAALFGQESSPPATATEASAATNSISTEVAEAEAAIVKNDWKTAEDKLDLWLAHAPTDARALFDAGYVADAQNRLEDAATLYQRAVEANPKSFEAHVELGMLLARQGKTADARKELTAATELDPGVAGTGATARAWRALAQIDRASDPAAASADLLQALKLSPETTDDTLLAASLAEQSGQNDAAEKAYRRVLASDANSAPANAGLAHVMIVRKEYFEAEELLRKALAQSPGDPALTAQLATVLAAEDKPEALPLLQKLHEAHPKDAEITRMLADVLAVAGDPVASDKLYMTLLAARPDDPELLVAHGENLTHELNYGAAFAVFDKVTRLDPANADGWSGLAFAASRTNQPTITLHALTMRSKLLPELPSTYFLWATAYDTLHENAQAIAYYHHFMDASAGKFPNQEWQARQRLLLLEKK